MPPWQLLSFYQGSAILFSFKWKNWIMKQKILMNLYNFCFHFYTCVSELWKLFINLFFLKWSSSHPKYWIKNDKIFILVKSSLHCAVQRITIRRMYANSDFSSMFQRFVDMKFQRFVNMMLFNACASNHKLIIQWHIFTPS